MADRRNYGNLVNLPTVVSNSSFGMRLSPTTQTFRLHAGVDIPIPVGTQLKSASSGEVFLVASDPKGYGNFIVIAHPSSQSATSYTLYAHLNEPANLLRGAAVAAGEVIGSSGRSGPPGTGAHLHYEERELPLGAVLDFGTDKQRYQSFFQLTQPINPALDKFGFELATAVRSIDALSPNTAFAQKLASLESAGGVNNGYGVQRLLSGEAGFGAIGRYQMRSPALQEIGWLNPDGTFTERARLQGVTSVETFLNTPAAQEAARVLYMAAIKTALIKNQSWKGMVGERVDGVGPVVSEAGIIAAAWKEGPRAVGDWADDNATANQTTNIEFRLKQFEQTNFTPGVFAPSALPSSPNGELVIDPITQAALDSAFFGTVPGAPDDAVFVPVRATGTPVQPPSNPTADYVNSHIIPGRDGKTLLFPGGASITLGAGEAYHLSSDLRTVTIARPAEGGVYIKTIYNTQLRSVGGEVVIGEGTPGRMFIKVNDPLAVNIDRIEGGVVVDAGNTIYTLNNATGAAVLIVNSRDAQGNAISSVKIRSNTQEALTEVSGAQGAAVLSNGTVKIYTEQGVRSFDQGALSAAEPVPTNNPQGADSLNDFINKDRTPETTPTNPPNPNDSIESLSSNLQPWLTDLANQLDAGNVSLYASTTAANFGRVFGFEDDFVYRGKNANGFIKLETIGGDGQSGLPAGLAVYYDTQTRQFILPARDDTGPMLVNLNAGATVALFNGQPKPLGWGYDTDTTLQLEGHAWDTVASSNAPTISTVVGNDWIKFGVSQADGANADLTGIQYINGAPPANAPIIDAAVAAGNFDLRDILGDGDFSNGDLSGSVINGDLAQIIAAADPTNASGTPPLPATSTPAPTPGSPGWAAWVNSEEGKRFYAALTNTQNLLAAAQGGNPVPLVQDIFNFADSALQETNPILASQFGGAANGLGTVNSFRSLARAIERGDPVEIARSGAPVASYIISTYAASLSNQIISQFGVANIAEAQAERFWNQSQGTPNQNLNELLDQYSGTQNLLDSINRGLPYLQLLSGLKNGDPVSIIAGGAQVGVQLGLWNAIPGLNIVLAIYTRVVSLQRNEYYEIDSKVSKFYAGYLPEMLQKEAANDQCWRSAA